MTFLLRGYWIAKNLISFIVFFRVFYFSHPTAGILLVPLLRDGGSCSGTGPCCVWHERHH
jgi:hypothetical protein